MNENKQVSADVKKSSGSVLLSVAAKRRVVAERDLRRTEHKRHYGLERRSVKSIKQI